MTSPCRAFREALHDPRGSLGAHAVDCADCAAFAARAARAAAALAGLERRAAPPELDGLVVASFQAGARQDRAVRALAELAPLEAPAQADAAVAARVEFAARHPEVELGNPRLHAPHVLERLVAEELADPAAGRARRFVGSLPRLHAPEDLAQGVHRDLAAGTVPAALRRRRPARLLTLSLAAAALALVTLLGPWSAPWRAPAEAPRHHLRLEAASLGDLEALGSYPRGWIAGLGGGILSASRQAR